MLKEFRKNNSGAALAWAIMIFLIVTTLIACILPLAASSILSSNRKNVEQQSYYTAKSVVDSIIGYIQADTETEGTSGYNIYSKAVAAGSDGVTWKVSGLAEDMGEAQVTVSYDAPYLYINAVATKGTEQTSLTAQLYKGSGTSEIITETSKFVSGPYGIMANNISALDSPLADNKLYAPVLSEQFPYNIMLLDADEEDAEAKTEETVYGTVCSGELGSEKTIPLTEINMTDNRTVKSLGSVYYDAPLIGRELHGIFAAGDIRLGSTENVLAMGRNYEVTQYDSTVLDTYKKFYTMYAGGKIDIHGSCYMSLFSEDELNKGASISGGEINLTGDGTADLSYAVSDNNLILKDNVSKIELEGYRLIEADKKVSMDNVTMFELDRSYDFDTAMIKSDGIVSLSNSCGAVLMGYSSDTMQKSADNVNTEIYGSEVNIHGVSDSKGAIVLAADIYVSGSKEIVNEDKTIYTTTGTADIYNENSSNEVIIDGKITADNLNVAAKGGNVTVNNDICGDNIVLTATGGIVTINGNITAKNLSITTDGQSAAVMINGNVTAENLTTEVKNGSISFNGSDKLIRTNVFTIKAASGMTGIMNNGAVANRVYLYSGAAGALSGNFSISGMGFVYGLEYIRYTADGSSVIGSEEDELVGTGRVSQDTSITDFAAEYENKTAEPYEFHEEYISQEIDLIETNDQLMPFDLKDKDGKYVFVNERIAGNMKLFSLDTDGAAFAKTLSNSEYPALEVELKQVDAESTSSVYYVDENMTKKLSLGNIDGNYYVIIRDGATLSLSGAKKTGSNCNLIAIVQNGGTLKLEDGSVCQLSIYSQEKGSVILGNSCSLEGSVCGGSVVIGDGVSLKYSELIGDVSVSIPLTTSPWKVLKYEETSED